MHARLIFLVTPMATRGLLAYLLNLRFVPFLSFFFSFLFFFFFGGVGGGGGGGVKIKQAVKCLTE